MDKPSWRKPVGVMLILGIILIWAVIVATLAVAFMENAHVLVQAIFYFIAGIIWIVPIRPILVWMELGKWTLKK